MDAVAKLKGAVRDVPDFPVPGILFKDITPILQDPALFRMAVDLLAERTRQAKATTIAAVEARGFFFGGAVADRLGLGLAPIRKKGKLPYKTFEESYALEYGTATLSIHQDALKKNERVIVIDDLLATGGTALATAKLVERLGGKVVEMAFLIELAFLKGRARLDGYTVTAPIVY
jgi:adenine phosphoribosyltransferase